MKRIAGLVAAGALVAAGLVSVAPAAEAASTVYVTCVHVKTHWWGRDAKLRGPRNGPICTRVWYPRLSYAIGVSPYPSNVRVVR